MDYKNGKLKISFCTVCMNRLYHLVKTLPKNIEDNKDYGNVEFVVLDYNSQDGMQAWVRENMAAYIESGLVLYVRVDDMPFFHMSHSKNVAAKCATGDVICNVDADNFIGKGFAAYINEAFSSETDIVLTPERTAAGRDVMGRICLRKKDFMEIGGYHENLLHYSYEDDLFLNKARENGLKIKYIRNEEYLGAIPHSNYDRLKHGVIFTRLKELYFRHVSSSESQVIMLYKDGTFEKGTLSLNPVPYQKFKFPLVYDLFEKALLKDQTWEKGSFSYIEKELVLSGDEDDYKFRVSDNGGQLYLQDDPKAFSKISDQNFILTLVYTWSTVTNLNIMENNAESVPEYGKAVVYKNFSTKPYSL